MVGVVPDKVENGRSEGSLKSNACLRSHVTFIETLNLAHYLPRSFGQSTSLSTSAQSAHSPLLILSLVIFHFDLDCHRVKSLSHHHFHHIFHARLTPRLTLSHHHPASRTCFRPDTHLNVNHHRNDTLRDEHRCLPSNRAGCALERGSAQASRNQRGSHRISVAVLVYSTAIRSSFHFYVLGHF